VGAIVENIIAIILQSIVKFGGLVEEQLASCWVCFGCDKDSMFQGHHIGITMQVKENTTPYFIGVCYMAHQINLAIVALSKVPFVFCIEAMLHPCMPSSLFTTQRSILNL
jgi:hydrogenase/urease accessory protein HupE